MSKSQVVGVKNELGSQAPGVIETSELLAISPAEAVFKAKEDTKKIASAMRIPDQALLEDQIMARGRVLEIGAVYDGIKKLNPRILILKGGVKNAVQLRYPVSDQFEDTGTEYITGFYIDEPLPEYSSVTVDANGLPHREIRGWRSVLSALIRRGLIDPKKADIVFGTAIGQRSELWHRSLQAQGKN